MYHEGQFRQNNEGKIAMNDQPTCTSDFNQIGIRHGMMSEPRKRYMEGRFIEGVGGVVHQSQ